MKQTLVLAACAAGLSLPVLAARPLQTDDAGVLEPSVCEAEAGYQRQRADGARRSQTDIQLGCGIGWNTQLGLGVATASESGSRQVGVALAGKHGLWQADAGSALALSWQIAASRARAESWRHEGRELRLIGSQPLHGLFTLHANLGHSYHAPDRRHSTVWGLALEHEGLAVLPRLAPMVEVYGDDREPASWGLGLRYAARSDQLYIDAGYGRQFGQRRPSLLTIGVTLAF